MHAGHSDKQLHTELDLSSDLFLDFANRGGTPSDATFNVRDLKAMVALCEAMHAHVAISFDSPGQPLVVAPHPTGNDGQVPPGTWESTDGSAQVMLMCAWRP